MRELFNGLRNASTSECSKTLSTEDDAKFKGCIDGWNVQMFYELNQIFNLIRFAGRDTIRCRVLVGADYAFCRIPILFCLDFNEIAYSRDQYQHTGRAESVSPGPVGLARIQGVFPRL
jgi:hypothetical protein